jgi:undecaprenyl diphosphate synthase
MGLFVEALRREVNELHRNNVRLRFVGALQQLSDSLRNKIAQAEQKTADNRGLVLTIAIAYGGRWDIVEAARSIAQRVADGTLQVGSINEDEFSASLQLAGLPDPDLLIRTGGEQRLSDFLLWECAYAELYFSELMWPEFTGADLEAAVNDYYQRERRFGAVGVRTVAS